MKARGKLRSVWTIIGNVRATGIDRVDMAVCYRGWQLGHKLRVRRGGAASSIIRCSCGWEGRAAADNRITAAALDHLSDAIKSIDGVGLPRISVWPPSIHERSSLHDLLAVLEETDKHDQGPPGRPQY